MINIHWRLEELSKESQKKEEGNAYHNIGRKPFHYRTPRSNPGSGLYRQYDDCRLLLQVHDELVYEVRPEELPEVSHSLPILSISPYLNLPFLGGEDY